MTTGSPGKPLALITGAAGGMGIACARVLGRRYRLIVTDFAPEPLASLTDQLRRDGVEVVGAPTGDISATDSIAEIARLIADHGGLHALVHTAGVSPALGDWETILRVNLGATLDLLAAVTPLLAARAAGVIMASMAAHAFRSTPEIDATLDTIVSQGLPGQLEAIVRGDAEGNEPRTLGVSAYAVSKYAVRRLCERRAPEWGSRDARLNSVTPGMIATPMGRIEAEQSPEVGSFVDMAPVRRWGTPLDIADAVEFLLSDAAGFISGCDLRVDGGLTPVLLARPPAH